MVNATIVLMRLECKRFTKMKDLAWWSDNLLTPRGEMEYNKTFEGISYRDFNLTIEEKEDHYKVATSRRCKPNKMFYVIIPKEPTRGSYFGRCSCGVWCGHERCGAMQTHGSYCDKYKDTTVDTDKYHATLVDAQHLAAPISY